MYKAQHGGLDLQNRKAKLITVMAVVILSIFILGCPTDGGPGPVITPDPEPVVTGVSIISTATEVTKGIPLTLAAQVNWSEGKLPTGEITWSISSGYPSNPVEDGTGIDASTGILTVVPAESLTKITVKAAYTANPTVHFAEKTLDVKPGTATVDTISINGDSLSVNKGESITLSATVSTTPSNADKAVKWEITTVGTETGTSLSNTDFTTGSVMLYVDASESKTSIEVQITSSLDPSKTATKSISVSVPPPDYNFTEEADANLLGLYPGSTGYTNGAAVISDMDDRIETSFYDSSNGSIVDPSYIYGITNVYYNQIAGTAPSMAWIINGDDLIVYGWNDTNATIIFNIAVIHESNGTGWITGDENTYLRSYSSSNSGSEKISISALTNNQITTATGLNEYKVYVIVRGLGAIPGYDFNDQLDAYNDENVIAVTTVP
jgi:hypothetical protein